MLPSHAHKVESFAHWMNLRFPREHWRPPGLFHRPSLVRLLRASRCLSFVFGRDRNDRLSHGPCSRCVSDSIQYLIYVGLWDVGLPRTPDLLRKTTDVFLLVPDLFVSQTTNCYLARKIEDLVLYEDCISFSYKFPLSSRDVIDCKRTCRY